MRALLLALLVCLAFVPIHAAILVAPYRASFRTFLRVIARRAVRYSRPRLALKSVATGYLRLL